MTSRLTSRIAGAVAVGALALSFLTLGSVSSAEARNRSGSVTTARGTTTGSLSSGCSGGTCTRNRTVTGPAGKSATAAGSVTKTDNGYDYSSTRTGPNGTAVDRSGSVSVTPPQ